MKCNQEVNLFCFHFQYKKSTVSATNISSGWIKSRFTCYFCCCLQHKKSTLVIPKTECNQHSAEMTLPCAAAAALTLQEVPGWSALCEIPRRLSMWLERWVMLPCFFTWLLHILQRASDLIRTYPSLQKPECFHTNSLAPLQSATLHFAVILRFVLLSAHADDVTDRQAESSNV